MWLSLREIGDRVLAIRRELPGSPSQAAMAKMIGREKSGSTIGGVERGEMWTKEGQTPDVALLHDIAALAGLTLDHFKSGTAVDLEREEMRAAARWMDKMADELRDRSTASSGGDAFAKFPKATNVPQLSGPSGLKRRFAAAIKGFSDLEVEEMCDMNHETVRQWRRGEWPVRGPNRTSSKKILAMITRYEAILKEDSILTGENLPPEAAGLIKFAEDRELMPAFVEEHPKLGWIYLADELAKAARKRDRMTIYDEFMWLGYKRAHRFDPETASRVTPEDVGIDVDKFFKDLDEPADSNK